ncbi:leukocyte elastase inhibitor, partial [Biomphalaria glabrata]
LSSRTDVTIQIGLGLYINPFYSIRPDFSESVARNYFSEVAHFNLTADGGAERPINDYMLSKTPSLTWRPLID